MLLRTVRRSGFLRSSRYCLSRAIGKQLTCVFVDHGLLRKNEGDEVEAVFGPNGPVRPEFYPRQRTGALLYRN